jgi:hypothetical protein
MRTLSTMQVLKDSWDFISFLVKSSDFSDYSNLLRAEFQQSDRLQTCITPRPFIILRCTNNRLKPEKVIFNCVIQLIMRFPSEQSHICNLSMLIAVKSDLTLVPKLSFWRILGEFEDGHCHDVLPARWDAHHISMRTHFIRWSLSACMGA